MITVRFPGGQAVQYNSANWVTRRQGFSDLLTAEGGSWVAQVPNDCIIEFVTPCRVYDALAREGDARLCAIEKELRAIKRRLPKPMRITIPARNLFGKPKKRKRGRA